MTAPRLVLASGSATRLAILSASGIAVDVHPSDVDESTLKLRLRAEGASAADAALALAEEKARAIAAVRPDAPVLGADQILTCEGRWFDKPRDLAEARAHLLALRGRAQTLHTACVLLQPGVPPWRHLVEPRLLMREFGEAVLDAYLAREGETLCASVGACRIEGPGYLLFERIEGEHAAILGLPLLALAAELRRRGLLPT
jgi:septum formation protein